MSWKPRYEVYCLVCCRMVAAMGSAPGLRPLPHYVLSMNPTALSGSSAVRECGATRFSQEVGHGMEEPTAAFAIFESDIRRPQVMAPVSERSVWQAWWAR